MVLNEIQTHTNISHIVTHDCMEEVSTRQRTSTYVNVRHAWHIRTSWLVVMLHSMAWHGMAYYKRNVLLQSYGSWLQMHVLHICSIVSCVHAPKVDSYKHGTFKGPKTKNLMAWLLMAWHGTSPVVHWKYVHGSCWWHGITWYLMATNGTWKGSPPKIWLQFGYKYTIFEDWYNI